MEQGSIYTASPKSLICPFVLWTLISALGTASRRFVTSGMVHRRFRRIISVVLEKPRLDLQ